MPERMVANFARGSEFVTRLPMSEKSARAEHPDPEQITITARDAVHPLRVLVVDDNEDPADMLGMALLERGHVVMVAYDPINALMAASTFRPHVAVLDIGLPGIDGYELAGRLRAQLGDAPCRLLALTGYGLDKDKARSKQAGFEEHLVKPVDMERLLALIIQSA